MARDEVQRAEARVVAQVKCLSDRGSRKHKETESGMKITVRNLQKKVYLTPRKQKAIKQLIRKTCASESIKKPGEITVCLVTNSLIRELNLNYLADYRATDVMAFDLAQKGCLAGDIVISTDTAVSNARRFKTSAEHELFLYAVHGMLHLLGYDDETLSGRRTMDRKAEAILQKYLWPYTRQTH